VSEVSLFVENDSIWRALDEIDTNALFFIDVSGVICNINKGVTRLLGYSEDEIIGKRVELLMPPDVREIHKSLISNYVKHRIRKSKTKSGLIGTQRTFPAVIEIPGSKPKRFSVINKNNQEIAVILNINEVWSDSDNLIGFIAIIQNNTEQYSLQQKLHYRATHDEHTGLINWQEFEHRIQEEKKRSVLQENKEYCASILYLDIDYFEPIPYYSQKVANSALRKVAAWLLNNTRQNEGRSRDYIVSHIVGDEFVIYLPDTPLDGAMILARRLQAGFRKLNLRTAENPFYSSASIGIADMNCSTSLQYAVSRAANACRGAKEKGKDRIMLAKEGDDNHLRLEPLIREALRRDRLKLYAQMIVPLKSGANKIDDNKLHYEVLSRIEDGQGNIISPMEFIPAAEQLGIAKQIDRYVIEKVLTLLRQHPAHLENLSLCSINLSGVSVSDERMPQFIERMIHKSGIDPRKLCFEITETYEIHDNEIAMELVTRLRRIGCKFAFDDFGIGYSNYQSFSHFPIDIVKIDGSYVRRLLTDHPLRVDVEGIINSARARGLEIVAEYAENEEIVAEIEKLGVDYAQGYYFSRPEPIESLLAHTSADKLCTL
jgi:diguanylate cyclase (GGDEF)-like protein